MTVGEVKRQIDETTGMLKAWEREYGVPISPSIHFTGGEPFLYEGLWEVIAYSRKRQYEVAVLTNGSMIREEDAEKAALHGVSDVQVSIEGPPDLHDAIRGPGSYDLACRGAEHLAAAGIRISANVTLSRINVDAIEQTAGIARKMGFCAMGFSRVVPCGRGKSLMDSFLTPQELKSAYQRVAALNSPSFEVVSGDPLSCTLSASEPPSGRALTFSGCSAGFSGVTICSDGSVMPCRRIGLVAGNLRKTSLRMIWASSKLLWQLRRRESYRGKCGRCGFWPSCRGCRAVAYANSVNQGNPDLFADDPQCWIPEKTDESWAGGREHSEGEESQRFL
jgi:radical SAM protein with 4Fe4S-binding SPASM domain